LLKLDKNESTCQEFNDKINHFLIAVTCLQDLCQHFRFYPSASIFNVMVHFRFIARFSYLFLFLCSVRVNNTPSMLPYKLILKKDIHPETSFRTMFIRSQVSKLIVRINCVNLRNVTWVFSAKMEPFFRQAKVFHKF